MFKPIAFYSKAVCGPKVYAGWGYDVPCSRGVSHILVSLDQHSRYLFFTSSVHIDNMEQNRDKYVKEACFDLYETNTLNTKLQSFKGIYFS